MLIRKIKVKIMQSAGDDYFSRKKILGYPRRCVALIEKSKFFDITHAPFVRDNFLIISHYFFSFSITFCRLILRAYTHAHLRSAK